MGGFVAQQAKFAVMKTDAPLGGHFHTYAELFFLLEGEAVFTLKDVERGTTQVDHMVKGDRLFIPSRIAHKGEVTNQSVLVGFTEEIYVSPEENDHPYDDF